MVTSNTYKMLERLREQMQYAIQLCVKRSNTTTNTSDVGNLIREFDIMAAEIQIQMLKENSK